ncbi:hypothetical protein TRICI_001025 [Trichomonascus ciferrii]|uniref:N-acetyltransferase domain-containing protein n=1 Tax=Trichomonascus ciferrii TaxID=44093 RepID=A0A642VBS4_9ASCO|nr:hypothetical protein TRICI_001025 [Trichomonascus ciferrii]
MDEDQFYCTQVVPKEVTYEQCLELGELQSRGFEGDEYIEYIRGQKYAVNVQYSVLLQGIKDPRERLNEMVSWAKRYRTLVNSWARVFYVLIHQSGIDLHLAIDKNTEKPVGISLWKYPPHMAAELDQKLGRMGILWTLKTWWVKFTCFLPEFWLRLRGLHPSQNERSNLVHSEADKVIRENIDKIASQESRDSYNNPLEPMVSLKDFVISPDYQRRGLGQRLMKFSFETIPNVRIPLSGSKTEAQRLYLNASPPGFGMYQKAGWKFTGVKVVFSVLRPEAAGSVMTLTR